MAKTRAGDVAQWWRTCLACARRPEKEEEEKIVKT
jgi:hypothetical protein